MIAGSGFDNISSSLPQNAAYRLTWVMFCVDTVLKDELLSSGVYPSNWTSEATLKDGFKVYIRPIRPDDAPRLQQGFRRLSKETIYMRFLEIFSDLPDDQAQRFANVDYQTSMALVGSIQEEGEEHLVAVARYACVGGDESGLAECAIVVRDDFQNRGLGKFIILQLVEYARLHGVKAFIGTIHARNAKILHFIEAGGVPFDRKMVEPGVWEYKLRLV